MAASVLNIDTLTDDYPVVVIDGERYTLTPPDMLSLQNYKRIERITDRLNLLWLKPNLTEEEETEIGGMFDSLCRIVLHAPNEVHARLTDMHRAAVYQSFQTLPQKSPQLTAAIIKKGQALRAIGANPSPVSRVSTVGTRGNGSRKRRSRSSARA